MPIGPRRARRRHFRQRQAAFAAGVAVAFAVAAATLLTMALTGGRPGAHDTAGLGRAPVPSADTGAGTEAAASPRSLGVPGSARATGSARASPALSAGCRPAKARPAGGGSASGPRPASGPGSPGSPVPSARSATATATIRATPAAKPRPEQGTLTVAPSTITIPPPGSSATLTLTALNGPVNWSITLSQGLIGGLAVAPSSGSLAAGTSTTISITGSDLLTAGGQLAVEPGKITVTVVLAADFGASYSVPVGGVPVGGVPVGGVPGAPSVAGKKPREKVLADPASPTPTGGSRQGERQVAGNLPRRGGKFPASGPDRGWYAREGRSVLSICVVAALHRYMRDSEVVAAIVAGDPDGLAEAYDRYAAPLYTYCRSLLREPADAADVVQDTFVIAASRLGGLRDQNRLRPWLYAVARNECYRRMRATAANTTAPLDTMPDITDAAADAGDEIDRAELRALLRSAVRGLNASDQDLIELQLRQGLDVAEIAAMLGVSRNHAHALLSRARGQLETALGALLVARTGREDCAALGAMLEDWDGQLTVLMRKRISRHVERCPVCAERKRRELAPALLLGLAPLAGLPIAAMPAGLRGHVLKLASSNTPEAIAHRASVAQTAASFGQAGFPKPLNPPKLPRLRTWQGQAAVGGAVAAIVAAAVIGVALATGSPGHHGGAAAFARGPVPGSSSGGSSGGSSGRGAGSPSQRPHPTVPGSGGVPTSPVPVAAISPSPTAGSGSPTGHASPTGPGSPTSTAPQAHTSPPAPAPSSSGVTAAPNSSPPSTSTPSATPPPSTPPPQGTLSVSPTSILLSVGSSAAITLTASNGPVNWSITPSQGLIGGLTVSPSSGTLAAGASTTVTVTASDLLTVGGQLTVEPGGISVTVVLSVNVGGVQGGLGVPGAAGAAGRWRS